MLENVLCLLMVLFGITITAYVIGMAILLHIDSEEENNEK